MIKVSDIVKFFGHAVPNAMKMDFDNVGFLVGDGSRDVNRVLVALDITDEVVDEAIEYGAELIVSHHPMFFQLKSVTDGSAEGRKIVKLLSNGISAICLHTNLDSVEGGVNDALLEVLGLEKIAILEVEETLPDGRVYGCGRVGKLAQPMDIQSFLKKTKAALDANGLRYHDAGKPVSKVAVCGGSGGSMIADVLRHGCDTYVTADVKYDQFLTAKECGLNIIDGDHFCTENVVIPVLENMIKTRFSELEVFVSMKHKQTAQFF